VLIGPAFASHEFLKNWISSAPGTHIEELESGVMAVADTCIRSDAVVSRLIAGETLVIPVRGGVGDLASIYRLNEVGTMIWEALAGPVSVEGLVNLIEREYDVSRNQARKDLVLFLAEMSSAGLVTVANAPEESHLSNGSAIMEASMMSR